MASVEMLSIDLTPEMARLVCDAVERGEHANNSEVVREALREWGQRRALQQQDVEELRRLRTEGLASGPGCLADMKALKAEARHRLAHKQQTRDR